jgi:Probable N6-adenine methyltransferase
MIEATTVNVEQMQRCRVPRNMFANGFRERLDIEQYFWTESTVHLLMKALEFSGDCCCMTTPTLANAFHMQGNDQLLLDIDRRWEVLPKFRYWDLLSPTSLAGEDPFRIIIFDPPFFYIPMETLYKAVLAACDGDTTTKLLVGFLKREESELMRVFAPFQLKRTNFPLEYSSVKPNKWRNYCLYSNVDLPSIRRQA